MGTVGSLHNKSNSNRKRPYALMVLIAFGTALLGVMLLHKFRERRLCNLLLQRTDQDLLSFQLLFQREKDRSKELEKSNEDLTASLYLLRTHNMELDRRLLELQSTIHSLKDEHKIINVALQEKQGEIQGLTQRLNQKEGELQDLRHPLESRGAVAANDPSDSNQRGNSTVSEEPKEQLLESSSDKGGETQSMDNNRGESKSTQKAKETNKEGGKKQNQEKLGDKGENVIDRRQVDGEATKVANDHKEKEGEDSEAVEEERADKIRRSGMKLKTETGKYGNTRKIRGKRWRYIAKRRTVDNGWRLISKKGMQENKRNLDDGRLISTTQRKFNEGATERTKEHTEKAKEILMDKENKNSQQESLNSENSEQNGNGEMGEGNIKQNRRKEMQQKDSKSKEKQEPEQGMESNEEGKVEEEDEEENKDEADESEF